MSLYYITTSDWESFLCRLAEGFSLYGLRAVEEKLFWEEVAPDRVNEITVNRYRALQPVKSFFFPVKEEVTLAPKEKKVALLGVKECDIEHLKTMDAIFIGGALVDPYYAVRRGDTFIISCDCDDYLPSCFCTLIEGKPYPSKGFDINISPLKTGFIAETGSAWGEKIVSSSKELFSEAQPQHLEEREKQRLKITEAVKENNKDYTWSNPKIIVDSEFVSKVWETGVAKTCVECDACRFACGTCYCFLLSETSKEWSRIRTWDSCQSTGYGRVAGGANPRKTKSERLRNWYTCKLLYRPENFGFYACTGCGRCITVCQGKIDIRRSLQRLKDKIV
ncbi:MAG: 4Fe-4S dicluster domain-containing protein [Elusimicrobia bacterium]|nr:4Fe-4S dicluster domain-containing protein [Candidatus Liberimonas magnetica]